MFKIFVQYSKMSQISSDSNILNDSNILKNSIGTQTIQFKDVGTQTNHLPDNHTTTTTHNSILYNLQNKLATPYLYQNRQNTRIPQD